MSDSIDRYQILRELGRGGMATVYLAHDPRFDRQVALKVLPRQFLHDYTFLERFNREARTIARLEHTAIVPVHDFGEANGQPFLVMRYMSGGSLTERLRQGPLPLPHVVEVMRRLGDALDYSHGRGVVHRDLKPGNILFDDRDNAFLSDFGIAKLAEATATLTGAAIIGTPAYMSPEQAQGNLKIDGRSDVYALGIILFQMLTGRLPFEADTPAKQLVAHILSPIPQVSTLRPDLPKSCDSVISHAMAKNRDERFSTASKMAEAVMRAMQDKLPTARIESQATVLQTEDEVAAESPAAPDQIEARETAVSPEVTIPESPLVPTEVIHEPETPPAYSGETTLVDSGELPPQPLGPPSEATMVEDEVFIVEQESSQVTSISPLAPRSVVTTPQKTTSKSQATRKFPAWVWAVAALLLVVLVVGGGLLLANGPIGQAAEPIGAEGNLPEGVVLKEFIEERWSMGFDATSLTYGKGVWAVVMSQGQGDGFQTWHTNPEFPKIFIEERWEAGFDVTSLAYGDNRWAVVMSRGEGEGFQTWNTNPEFPKEFIQERWELGYDVTSLTYGNGVWAVVMSRGAGAGFQTWHTNPEFPKAFIQEKWNDGFDVTSLTFGKGVWAVVMSRGEGTGFQTWHTSPEFPKEFIDEKWNAGFDITSLTYGNGVWAVVMSRRSSDARQTWQTAKNFN